MVTANESQTYQQFCARNSPNLGHMALLQLEQNYSLPYFTPSALTANLAFPGRPNSDLHGLNTGQPNAVAGLLKVLPPYQNFSYPTGNPCLKTVQCAMPHRLGVSDTTIDASCAPRKRFLIFDRSGNHTRLFVSPSFSPQNHIITSKTPASANGSCEIAASRVDQQFLVKPVVEENHLNDGEGEMLEDTEEINALLYSDSDDEYDDDNDTDGENDDVTSTGHTLFSIEEGYNKDKSLGEVMEEVASSDGSPKRQKLLDGTYKKSSLVSVESPVKRATSCNYEDDVESRYGDIDSSKREKKVKIHEAMKILRSIIPGLKSEDPLSIIEKAIVYLERMKIEAKALGYSYLESESATFP